MYLVPSPTHTCSMHHILSIKTGLVSPQFHVNFDDFFESIKWEEFMPRSELQYKVRLLRERRSSTPDLDRVTMTKMLNNNRTNSNIDPGEENQTG